MRVCIKYDAITYIYIYIHAYIHTHTYVNKLCFRPVAPSGETILINRTLCVERTPKQLPQAHDHIWSVFLEYLIRHCQTRHQVVGRAWQHAKYAYGAQESFAQLANRIVRTSFPTCSPSLSPTSETEPNALGATYWRVLCCHQTELRRQAKPRPSTSNKHNYLARLLPKRICSQRENTCVCICIYIYIYTTDSYD